MNTRDGEDPQIVLPVALANLKEMERYLYAFRRVVLEGEITASKVDRLGLAMLRMEYVKCAPITILANSCGGSVDATYRLVDIINGLHSPVDIVLIGKNASMTIDLTLACRKRSMLPHATMLLHWVRHGREWIGDNPANLVREIEIFHQQVKSLRKKRMRLYMERTGLTKKEVRKLFRHGEVHRESLTAEQALGYGLIDEILTDFKFFPAPRGVSES